MRAAILSIGDEIVLGQQLDTNSMWLSAELVALGFGPVEHRTVADDRAAIAEAMSELARRVDVVVSTGGLGPTLDDLTREALGDLLTPGVPLVEDASARDHLAGWFAGRGRSMPASNWRQALRPASARTLDNPNGTAPGVAGAMRRPDGSSCLVACLPGPPREMRPMFRDHVAPELRDRAAGSVVFTATVMQVGLGESPAAELLGPLMARDRTPSVGTTASGGIVSARVRIEATPEGAGRAAEALRATVERVCEAWRPYVYAVQSGALPNVVGSSVGGGVLRSTMATGITALVASVGALVGAAGGTLAVAESCTGGLLGATIVDLAGSSVFFAGGFVTYSNALKTALIDVPAALIHAHGAVSEPVARAMAEGAMARTGATCAISITGVAGPDGGSDAKPVGTVFIAVAVHADVHVRRFRFTGDRRDIRERAVAMALQMLRLALLRATDAPLLWQVDAPRAPSIPIGAPAPARAFVAIGSNVGDRRATIDAAMAALAATPGVEVVRRSTLVETAPVGPPGQGPYLNGAAELRTSLSPRELLDAMLSIERRHGRVRSGVPANGPRTLDLDLLLHGDAVIDDPGLRVPHPRMHERRFVLEPLAEIAPEVVHPVLGGRIRSMLARLSDGMDGSEAC